jgi:glycerol-3-phosphate dehydrogenase subunit C
MPDSPRPPTTDESPEALARGVVAACVDCDVCRTMLADAECPVFDALYRLHDREAEGHGPITGEDLRGMVGLCTFCGLCGCADIRGKIIAAKTGFVAREGLTFSLRALSDVGRLGKICGAAPGLVNRLAADGCLGALAKRLVGIHRERRLPEIPGEDFDAWVRRRGLHRPPTDDGRPKVAYFVGCSGRFLFPAVPRAAVALLEAAGAAVFVPALVCCGMPTLLEGDREKTLNLARDNAARLAGLVDEGFTVVTSCPTCGYVLRNLWRERAYYAEAYQAGSGGDAEYLKVPGEGASGDARGFVRLRRSMFGKILRDDGYFAPVDPLARIRVGENVRDLGEYLRATGGLRRAATQMEAPPGRLVYFAPCHQREQKIGRPYQELLAAIPGIDFTVVDGAYDCCGMGGLMGFKKDFHRQSLDLGRPLAEKLRALRPVRVVTDCLSCRLQIRQMTPFPVSHPLEVLARPGECGAAGPA